MTPKTKIILRSLLVVTICVACCSFFIPIPFGHWTNIQLVEVLSSGRTVYVAVHEYDVQRRLSIAEFAICYTFAVDPGEKVLSEIPKMELLAYQDKVGFQRCVADGMQGAASGGPNGTLVIHGPVASWVWDGNQLISVASESVTTAPDDMINAAARPTRWKVVRDIDSQSQNKSEAVRILKYDIGGTSVVVRLSNGIPTRSVELEVNGHNIYTITGK